jgi:lipoprotein-anchoring transpeptidase ErfK/SrfK
MRLVFVAAFLAGALSAPAFADPIAIYPAAYAASQSADAAAAASSTAVTQQRYAQASQPNLGGGFIEFLFGGVADRPAAQAYQPAPSPDQPAPALHQDTMIASAPPDDASTQSPASDPPATGDETQQAYAPPQGYAPSAQDDTAQGQVDPKFNRQVVAYTGSEPPGTIIVDTPDKFLFLVQEHGTALRYGIGVGRPGFTWAGVKTVTAKREWPDWRPPAAMLKRQPELPRFMAGGPENPLGARALYLGSTDYRIHGSNEPWTIGTNVSSGCIRLRNADVIDLYNRVKVGTKVVVM